MSRATSAVETYLNTSVPLRSMHRSRYDRIFRDQVPDLRVEGRGERLGVDPLFLLVDGAVDRRLAPADAAGIHGDDVEAGVQRGQQLGGERLEVLDGRAAGAAEVEEQRADPVPWSVAGDRAMAILHFVPLQLR